MLIGQHWQADAAPLMWRFPLNRSIDLQKIMRVVAYPSEGEAVPSGESACGIADESG